MKNLNKANILTASATAATLFAPLNAEAKTKAEDKPNVIVIILDDCGSGDVGFAGSHDIQTPNIDRIALEGVNCTDAKITAPYSGPSRCGLLSGRYQQRFGAEGNTDSIEQSIAEQQGIPLSETTLFEAMKSEGYSTAVIGKWHAGDSKELSPNNRGADYFYGMTHGGHSFWGGVDPRNPLKYIQENGRIVPGSETTYLTDDFTDKALQFIDKSASKNEKFMLYLAYNAPHAPFHATEKYLARTKHITNPWRSVYAAMILGVDEGVGRIWAELERKGIEDDTLIIFLSDNGGEYRATNAHRQAFKGNMFEGGISTPFAMYWKGKIKPGTTYPKTISALDIYPTVIEAAGVDKKVLKKPLDGVDLLPYLSGKNKKAPHEKLFWRVCGGMEWAVRKGDYKMVKTFYAEEPLLFNLENDPIEKDNIAAANPQIYAQMQKDYAEWNAQMMEPRWSDEHAPHQIKDRKEWEQTRMRATDPRKRKK